MKHKNIKLLFFALAAIIVSVTATSCGPDEPQFKISGTIKNAEGKILYLSKVNTGRIALIDSVKLDEDGDFEFSRPALKNYEFYTLSLTKKGHITLVVNGTDEITVNADANDLQGSYTVDGSEDSNHIKEMNRMVKETDQQILEMIKNSPPETEFTKNRIDSLIQELKVKIADRYITKAPEKSSAYYALHLIVGGEPLFRPNIYRYDSKCYATVATSMQKNMPNSPRTKEICDIAKRGMIATREISEEELAELTTDLKTTGHFNIALPDHTGKTKELSSLKDKVVLLDFTFFGDEMMIRRNSQLDDLHMKYHDKGFEIYQISYDKQPHFWKTKANDYPWICVHDNKGEMSQYLKTYNITTIPTYFLINKENEVVLRDAQIEDLEKEIEKLLAE